MTMQVKPLPLTIEAEVVERRSVPAAEPESHPHASATGGGSEPRARRRGRRLSTVPERQIRCPACGQVGRPGRMELAGIPMTVEVCEMCIGTVERVSQFVGALAKLIRK